MIIVVELGHTKVETLAYGWSFGVLEFSIKFCFVYLHGKMLPYTKGNH